MRFNSLHKKDKTDINAMYNYLQFDLCLQNSFAPRFTFFISCLTCDKANCGAFKGNQ